MIRVTYIQKLIKKIKTNSFVPHLLKGGVGLRYIQELLRHRSSRTTEIYTHVNKANLASIKNPLDSIFGEEI